MKKFIYEPLVKRMILSRDWSFDQNEELAEKIAATYFARKSDEEIINNYIFCDLSISEIRDRVVGVNREIGRVNLLCAILCEYAAHLIAGDERMEKMLNTLVAKEEIVNGDGFTFIKLQNLASHVKNANSLLSYFIENSGRLVKTIDTFNDEYLSKGRTTDEVFAELLNLRKYGVKSAAFIDGIVSNPGDFWIYNSADYLRKEFDSSNADVDWQSEKFAQQAIKTRIANIIVNDKRTIEILPLSQITGREGDGVSVAVRCKTGFGLDFNGEICNSHTHISTNMRSIFEKRGHGELYELVRANAVFRLYSLIVPTFVNERNSVPKFTEPNIFNRLLGGGVKFDPKLYLKRVRTLFDKLNEIKNGLEEEVESSLSAKPSQALKREADVVSHIRRLPEGYKASEKSRALAKEILNYDLKDGETFVLNHTRNKGGEKNDSIHQVKIKH